MRKFIGFSVAAVMAASIVPASADTTRDERMLKAPEKSMGDEGKLPATEKMGNQVPDMTGPRTAATPGDDAGAPSGPKGPPKRMGDEGKLPATKNMSGAVPEMNSPK